MHDEVAGTVLAALARLARLAARPRRPALLRRPERARHRPGHRSPAGHGQVPPPRSPAPPGRRPRPERPRRPRGLPNHSGDRTMTMIDDDQLASLLTRAAEEFEVPAAGPDEIVWRARTVGAGRTATENSAGRSRSKKAKPTPRRRRRRWRGCAVPVAGGSPAPGRRGGGAPPRARRWRPASSPARGGGDRRCSGRSTPGRDADLEPASRSERRLRTRAGSPATTTVPPTFRHGPRPDRRNPDERSRGHAPSRRPGSPA